MTNGGHEKGYDIHAIRDAIVMSNRLIELGYAPFCPQLTILAEIVHPIPYEAWLGIDFEWIKVCDVVFRMNNQSKGADREVDYASEVGVETYFSPYPDACSAVNIDMDQDLARFYELYPPQVKEPKDEVTKTPVTV
jgi:hypothetical protein